MIIKDRKFKFEALEAISNSKDCSYYRMSPTGNLEINNGFKSYVFLAYVRGDWFASFGERKAASTAIPEKGLTLFVHGNNSLWIQNENHEVDISTPVIPLDKSTQVALFAFSGKNLDVIIADGSRYSRLISTSLPHTPENKTFLIMALASMIRQYDDKAADEILKFWFQKKNWSDSSKSNLRQVQFEKEGNQNTALKEQEGGNENDHPGS